MSQDLKSKTPGPLDANSRAFADRIGTRGKRDENLDAPNPGDEIDDTDLPLDDAGQDPQRSIDQSRKDIEGRQSGQPDSDNDNDLGEDETSGPLI